MDGADWIGSRSVAAKPSSVEFQQRSREQADGNGRHRQRPEKTPLRRRNPGWVSWLNVGKRYDRNGGAVFFAYEAVAFARNCVDEAWTPGIVAQRLPDFADGGVDAVLVSTKTSLPENNGSQRFPGEVTTLPCRSRRRISSSMGMRSREMRSLFCARPWRRNSKVAQSSWNSANLYCDSDIPPQS